MKKTTVYKNPDVERQSVTFVLGGATNFTGHFLVQYRVDGFHGHQIKTIDEARRLKRRLNRKGYYAT